MRFPTPAISGNLRRKPLVLLGFLILFVVAADKAAGYVIAGDLTSLALIALAFVGAAFVIATLNDWRRGLYFFLTWLLFDDFARKYLGNNMAIYFAKDDRWPCGYGIGTTALGTQYVATIFHAKSAGTRVESGFGTLVLEMGIGGLLLWLVRSLAIVFSAWRIVKKLRGSPWFPIAFMIFWYAGLLLLPMTFNGIQPYEDFVLNAYLWLLLGVLFRLPSIALSAQYAVAQLPQTYSPRIR